MIPAVGFKWSMEESARDVIGPLNHLEILQTYLGGEYLGSWAGIHRALIAITAYLSFFPTVPCLCARKTPRE